MNREAMRPLYEPAPGVRGVLVFLLLLLALCVDGWGCAGHAADASTAEPEEWADGWCCDGICGLSGEQADLFEQCFCVGVVRGSQDGWIGECVEAGTYR